MTTARASLVAALLAVPLLAGCGSSGDVSPHTTACRHYEIRVGTTEIATAAVVPVFTGETDGEALKASTAVFGAAASEAALTKNLSDRDFQRYRALSVASQDFAAKLDSVIASFDTDGSTPDQPSATASAAPLQKAIKAVEDACR